MSYLDGMQVIMKDGNSNTGAIPVYHSVCKGIAFYFLQRLSEGDFILSSNVVLVDGTRPKPGENIRCSTCKQGGGTIGYSLEEL